MITITPCLCTLYKKNEKLRSITLIQMARQQIELHRPQMALQALELVKGKS